RLSAKKLPLAGSRQRSRHIKRDYRRPGVLPECSCFSVPPGQVRREPWRRLQKFSITLWERLSKSTVGSFSPITKWQSSLGRLQATSVTGRLDRFSLKKS